MGSPKTRMPPLIAVTLAAALVSVMTGTASPFCRPRAEAKKAITEARMQVTSQGDSRPASPSSPTGAGERLDGHVGDAEEDAGRGAEHHAVMLVGAEPGREHQQGADHQQRGLEGDHAGERVARVGAAAARQRDGQQHQAERGEPDAQPTGACPTLQPKKRSAITVRKTSPPEITACTSESGASASAATWKIHATMATSMPIVNHLERNRPTALRNRVLAARRRAPRRRRGASAGSRRSWRERRPAQAGCRVGGSSMKSVGGGGRRLRRSGLFELSARTPPA